MSRSLTSATSLDSLKKEARRWWRRLRDGDPDARSRWLRARPDRSAARGLRDVQHAIAREYGFVAWAQLKQAVTAHSPQ